MLEEIKERLSKNSFIYAAIYYGTSSVSLNEKEDLDLAIILNVDSEIDLDYFIKLIKIRKELIEISHKDIDLIPHTLDEVIDNLSPLYNPRYNPPIVYGKILKGQIKISVPSNILVKQSDILKSYISLDRTIIRRLICRDYSCSDNIVLINKIKKIAPNIINYLTIKNNINYYNIDENNIENNIEILDLIYKIPFKERLIELFYTIKNDIFKELPESEKFKLKTDIGIMVEKIFNSFFTKEIDLSKFNSRIKSILSSKQQKRIME